MVFGLLPLCVVTGRIFFNLCIVYTPSCSADCSTNAAAAFGNCIIIYSRLSLGANIGFIPARRELIQPVPMDGQGTLYIPAS